MNSKSKIFFQQAKAIFPGGVNSPVRAFNAVGGTPPFIERGQGPYLFDVDGKRYVDYVLSYGPLILGHAHPAVVDAIAEAAARGTSYGMPTEHAIRLAQVIQNTMPSLQMLRFVNSGTEATMSALRLARAFTRRAKIVKFDGCYHGHADYLLVKAGSGVATLGLPDSPGVTAANTHDTLTAPYNDLAAVEKLLDEYESDLAAIIVEPVAGNMGLVPPVEGFLEGLRKLCDHSGALLIFDEVMTGFRVDPSGAQGLYQVAPDLTTLGKVIGGGLPVGAYGGRRDIMELVAPLGPMYQAGTLSANPLAMVAGLTTLEVLLSENRWAGLLEMGVKLDDGIRKAAAEHDVPVVLERVGTMSGMYFLANSPLGWSDVQRCDKDQFKTFFHAMLERGVFLAPSPFEAAFISTAHDQDAVDLTINAAKAAFAKVKQSECFRRVCPTGRQLAVTEINT
jgi:glutamate-1-semialdehyde 2,1-aminomutase